MIENSTRQENEQLHDVRNVADDANEDPAESNVNEGMTSKKKHSAISPTRNKLHKTQE
ncbi:Hypothetical predicted protein, partial [Paramuricea clavata]